MTWLPGLGEKIAITLTLDLVKASAAVVRRKLARSEETSALQRAVAAALGEAIAAVDVPEALRTHYEHLLESFFSRETVVAELAQLLDPRPDIEIDFAALKEEFARELEPGTLQHLELDSFLRLFASAFYAAAAHEPALRNNLEMKLLGEMVSRTGGVLKATERAAEASERMSALLARYLEDQTARAPLAQAVHAARDQGMFTSFQAFEAIAAGMFKAGFDFGVGRSGAIEIGAAAARPQLPAQVESIRTMADELRRTILAAEAGPAELDALEMRYRQHVIRWFESLQFQGLMRTPRPIMLPLEGVYVELRAVSEVPEAADAFSVEERRLLLEVDDKAPEARRELMSQLDTLRRERWSRTLPERKPIAETLRQRDRRGVVILGDPGSGKTTLLHFLALVYARGATVASERLGLDASEADRLPIFVPLAAFDDMLRERRSEGGSLSLLEFLPRYYDRRRGLPGLDRLFRRALESGRAVVLLDGLDEVLDVGTRSYIAQQAGALVGELCPHGVRFVISSRFVGYRDAPVPGGLPILSVLDFGPQEIEVFVRRWAHAYERWAANGVESPEMLRSARGLESDLLMDVRSNESVRRLAANPLMLTMLALLRRQVGKLPQRRVQLYESYVGALLETWVAARNAGAREKALGVLDRHRAENILLPLALWLQEEKPSGTAGRAELQHQLREICLAQRDVPRETRPLAEVREAEEQAERFLREMREMTGVLVERGHDAFGFLHLTLQEYFAGRALASLPDAERFAAIRPHLHEPRWREPILLCAGRLGVVENRRPQVTAFVQSILDCPDPAEEKLHRNLLLALAVAGDDVSLDPGLVSELVRRAMACLPTTVYALARSLVAALGQLAANGVFEAHAGLAGLAATDDWRFRRTAVEALGRFAGNDGVRELLLDRFADEDSNVVEAALASLTLQAVESEKVRAEAIRQLEKGHYSLSLTAATVLREIARSDEKLRTELMRLAGHSERFVRAAAVRALSGTVAAIDSVRSLVVERLNDDDTSVRKEAIAALAETARQNEAVKHALVAKLEERDTSLQIAAIEALSGQLADDSEVATALAKRLLEPASMARARALSAFADFGSENETLRHLFMMYLADPSDDVREEAVKALDRHLWTDDNLKLAVLGLLETGTEHDRRAVLQSLSGYRAALPEVRQIFASHAQSPAWSLRKVVAESLAEAIHENEDYRLLYRISVDRTAEESLRLFYHITIEGLRFFALDRHWDGDARWLNYWLGKASSADRNERGAAMRALGELAAQEPLCRQAIMGGLKDDDYFVLSSALDAATGLLMTDTEIRDVVLNRMRDQTSSGRYLIARALSEVMLEDDESRAALLTGLKDKNAYVRQTVLEVLAVAIDSNEDIKYAILERLQDDDSSVRHAAITGLAVLVEKDLVVRQALVKQLGGAFLKDPDRKYEDVLQWVLPAVSCLASVDAEVRHTLLRGLEAEDQWVRGCALRAVSSAVAKDPEICRIVMSLLSDKRFASTALRTLASVVEADEVVREAVLGKLADEEKYVRVAALEALAGLVAQDPRVRDATLSLLEDKDSYVRWSTLRSIRSIVRIDSEAEAAVRRRLEDGKAEIRARAVETLSECACSSPSLLALIAGRLEDRAFEVRVMAAEAISRDLPDTAEASELRARVSSWLAVEFDLETTRELDPRVRERILVRLGRLLGPRLPNDASLRDSLVAQLRDPRWSARCGAAVALLAWPGGPPDDILERIAEALDDRRGFEAYPAQLAAAAALINREAYADQSIELCLEALDYGARPWECLRDSHEVRMQAALVLGKLEPLFYDKLVYERLLHVMEQDEVGEVRDAAYGALVRLARVREKVATPTAVK